MKNYVTLLLLFSFVFLALLIILDNNKIQFNKVSQKANHDPEQQITGIITKVYDEHGHISYQVMAQLIQKYTNAQVFFWKSHIYIYSTRILKLAGLSMQTKLNGP